MSKRRILLLILAIFLVAIIVLRILLPGIITKQVNKRLAELDGYEGSISGVDLHLYRGAAKIFDFKVDKYNEDQAVPFVDIPSSDFSIEWKSLFNGAIVGEMILTNPSLNFEITPSGDVEQTGEEVDWVDLVKDLAPIKINTFEIISGEVTVDFPASDEPQFDFDMDNIYVKITNITNVEDEGNTLPSDILITSNLKNYGGSLNIGAQANMLKQIPDMDMNMKLEGMQLKSLNSFLEHYAGIDFNSGTLNLYSEVALKDKAYEGYLKPLLQDPVIYEPEEEDRNLWQAAKELVAEGVQELFENQEKEQTATRIPISGTLEDTNVNYWQTFIIAVRNAYIEALKNSLDGTVAFSEVINAGE